MKKEQRDYRGVDQRQHYQPLIPIVQKEEKQKTL